jgi:hypothetical protein
MILITSGRGQNTIENENVKTDRMNLPIPY